MSIQSFDRKRAPDVSLTKHKYHMCAHRGINNWGLNQCYNCPPVFNWVSVRDMLTLIIIIELHIKSVDFFLAYTQADVKTEIFMEFPIYFVVEGDHPREWVIRLDKKYMDLSMQAWHGLINSRKVQRIDIFTITSGPMRMV